MPVAVTEQPRRKRRWMPFWRLPTLPICDKCGAICIAARTVTTEDGRTVQYRRCPTPGCDGSAKSSFREPEPA